MRKHLLTFAFVAILAQAALVAIGTIKEVRLAEGSDDVNKITAPVFDTASVPAVSVTAFQSAYDKGAKIVRRGTSGMFTRGPEYNLEKTVDLGALLGDALRAEAALMGLKVAASGAAWQIGGTIKDVYLESKQIPYGATLFYGYMDVELQVQKTGGAAQPTRMRLHNYFGGYNAGMGRKDEAESGLAHLIVEGAQEVWSRLNREQFKAAPHAGIAAKLAELQASGAGKNLNALHLIGLSGTPSAVQPLLAMLAREPEENVRSAIIDAIGRLGSADAVAPLAARYATEDEDSRWYTLKAMDYIGVPEALALVKDKGTKDKDGAPKRLAGRIVAGT